MVQLVIRLIMPDYSSILLPSYWAEGRPGTKTGRYMWTLTAPCGCRAILNVADLCWRHRTAVSTECLDIDVPVTRRMPIR
jgi:hypothetical protein